MTSEPGGTSAAPPARPAAVLADEAREHILGGGDPGGLAELRTHAARRIEDDLDRRVGVDGAAPGEPSAPAAAITDSDPGSGGASSSGELVQTRV